MYGIELNANTRAKTRSWDSLEQKATKQTKDAVKIDWR
jgi:hypothetical protein